MKKTLFGSVMMALAITGPVLAAPSENIHGPMFGESRQALYSELTIHQIEGEAFTREYADAMVKTLGAQAIAREVDAQLETMKGTFGDFEAFKATAAKQLPVLKRFDASMHEYVVRLAELLPVSLETLWASFYADATWVEGMKPKLEHIWNNHGELQNRVFGQMNKGRGGCTTAAWTNGILGGNEDFASSFGGTGFLVVSDDLMFEGSYYGAWRAQGRHLGLVVNTLVTDSLADGAEGLPHTVIIASLVKRASGVEQAVAMLEPVRGESPFNYTMADDSGHAVAYNVLKWPRKYQVSPVNGAVAHTNHRTDSRGAILQAWGNDYQAANSHFGYSVVRRDMADALTRIVPDDERTPESMKSILRTQPILMRAARGEDFGTIYSFVMDVPKGCIYMAPDRPDLVEYVKVCFAEL